ncbi:hypothetical protein Lal_00024953 [Lupinus albus]|uniref:Putative START-like domain-containing protein n=1 Tax=Lupinus albus TaxID=3870 RepID=A0A6A4PUW2_LUPAL|nr:putative START-like domain-containing protein [Lupinus albus]KAF1889626.1 hypothetical protein Lal_00024953 [Lupinus albus]
MGVSGKLNTEIGIKTQAEKFFSLFAKQLQHVQNISDRIHEAKVHEGHDWYHHDSVKEWTFTIDGKVTTCKEKIELIDLENKSITFDLFDGDINQHYKILKINLQVIDKDDNGTIANCTLEYEKINESVEAPSGYLDYVTNVIKDVDHHLLIA